MEVKKTKLENKKSFKWRRTILYTFFFLLLIPVLSFFLIQFSPVQNAIIDYATEKINSSIDGKVSIDHVDLSITKGLKLEGFKLTEANGDTILLAESLNVDLSSSLYSLFDNSISIKKIDLESPQIRIVKHKGQSKNNLDLILEKFNQPSEGEPSGKPLEVSLKELIVSNFNLQLIDENTNQEQIMLLKRGSDKKAIDVVLRKLNKRTLTKGLKTSKYAGRLKLKVDGLAFQKKVRNEWG